MLPVALAPLLLLAGCAGSPAPSPATSDAPAPASSPCTEAQATFFITSLGLDADSRMAAPDKEGYPALMGEPSCAFTVEDKFIGVYLGGTQQKFDAIEKAYTDDGYIATPDAPAEGLIDSATFTTTEGGDVVASLQYGESGADTVPGGDFMLAAGVLDPK